MELLGDPEISISRKSPREPRHSHQLLDVTVEMGLKPRRLYWRRCHHHHLRAAPPNQNPTTIGTEPSHRWGPRSTPSQKRGRSPTAGDKETLIASRAFSRAKGYEIDSVSGLSLICSSIAFFGAPFYSFELRVFSIRSGEEKAASWVGRPYISLVSSI
jgi:hypothetical protein